MILESLLKVNFIVLYRNYLFLSKDLKYLCHNQIFEQEIPHFFSKIYSFSLLRIFNTK
jgi:hypothetical protein